MRVLHVSRFYHPHVGGTENFIASLCHWLKTQGHDSEVLVSDRHRQDSGPDPEVRTNTVKVIGPDRFPKPRTGFRTILSAFQRADVIHLHDVRFLLESSLLFQRARRTPLVLSTHGLIFHTERNVALKSVAWRLYFARALRRLNAVVCDSQQDFDACERVGLQNAVLIPNPVDIERLHMRSQSPDPNALLYFGRLDSNKGLDRLSGLLRADPSLRLTIVGSGSHAYLDRLRSDFHDGRDRVRFEGYVSRRDLASLLVQHACVVLPSRKEGFGLALVEAMGSGRPVVASDIPPFREIVGSHTEILTDFDNPEEAIRSIRSAIGQWDSDGVVLRARAFGWEEGIKTFVALYRSL